MINSEEVSNTYTGTGKTAEYAVTYHIYEDTDVAVYVAVDGVEEQKSLGTDYTVKINSDFSGGTVTFTDLAIVPEGCTIAILLNLPLLQELDLKASATIDTESTEQQLDKIVQMIQENAEKLKRAVTVPATMAHLGEVDVMAIYEARDAAQAAADSAKASADKAESIVTNFKNDADAYVAKSQAKIRESYSECAANLANLCQSCLQKLENLLDLNTLAKSLSCIEETWTLAEDVSKGSTVTIPDEFKYIVGVRHLRLAYDGVDMSPTWYQEVGSDWTLSDQIVVNIPLTAGQEMHAWCCPLGSADFSETAAKVAKLQEQLTDLSRRVVYTDTADTTMLGE